MLFTVQYNTKPAANPANIKVKTKGKIAKILACVGSAGAGFSFCWSHIVNPIQIGSIPIFARDNNSGFIGMAPAPPIKLKVLILLGYLDAHSVVTKHPFADEVEDRDVLINLTLSQRTKVHTELIKGDTLGDIQEEIRSHFEGRNPSIWMTLKLNTSGIRDIESLRQGKDFISDLIALFEIEGKSEAHPELEEVLKPMYETWQGKKYLKDLSDSEIRDLLVQARSLCLDRLLGSD